MSKTKEIHGSEPLYSLKIAKAMYKVINDSIPKRNRLPWRFLMEFEKLALIKAVNSLPEILINHSDANYRAWLVGNQNNTMNEEQKTIIKGGVTAAKQTQGMKLWERVGWIVLCIASAIFGDELKGTDEQPTVPSAAEQSAEQ